MITEIIVNDVEDLKIEVERLASPASDCSTIKIFIGAEGVSGKREWQVITLFCWDRPGEPKFEDGVIHRRILAFNETPPPRKEEMAELWAQAAVISKALRFP